MPLRALRPVSSRCCPEGPQQRLRLLLRTRLLWPLRLLLRALAQLPRPLLRLPKLLQVWALPLQLLKPPLVWARLLPLLRKRRLDLVRLLFLRLRLLQGSGLLPFPLLKRRLPVWALLGLWVALRQRVLERLPARLYLSLQLGPKG